jgi:hypothetical protein
VRDTKILMAALSMFACGCLTAVSQAPPANPPFKVCDTEYALCTFSECGEVIGQQPTVTCKCRVQDDKSVGTECAGPKTNADGQTIVRSRYHPISTYSRCTNNRPWAMCLDAPCTVDKTEETDRDDASKKERHAQCNCAVKQGQGDYVVYPGTAQCTNGLISSATVLDLSQITDFLETQSDLPVPDFKVVNIAPR